LADDTVASILTQEPDAPAPTRLTSRVVVGEREEGRSTHATRSRRATRRVWLHLEDCAADTTGVERVILGQQRHAGLRDTVRGHRVPSLHLKFWDPCWLRCVAQLPRPAVPYSRRPLVGAPPSRRSARAMWRIRCLHYGPLPAPLEREMFEVGGRRVRSAPACGGDASAHFTAAAIRKTDEPVCTETAVSVGTVVRSCEERWPFFSERMIPTRSAAARERGDSPFGRAAFARRRARPCASLEMHRG
jgi:hypothetical protein